VFQLLSKLFTQEKKPVPEADSGPQVDMPSHVHLDYHPELVSQLKKEHRIMVSLLSSITKQLSVRKMEGARKEFNRFTRILHGHLLKENLKLYTYLKHALANDPDNQSLAIRFQTEMSRIGRHVDGEVKKLSMLEWVASDSAVILEVLGGLSQALLERVQDEEAYLYPLYDQGLGHAATGG